MVAGSASPEEEVIAAKVENALRLDWPRERLQIIVADDGSTDATAERAREAGADLVLELPPGGKVAALNEAPFRILSIRLVSKGMQHGQVRRRCMIRGDRRRNRRDNQDGRAAAEQCQQKRAIESVSLVHIPNLMPGQGAPELARLASHVTHLYAVR